MKSSNAPTLAAPGAGLPAPELWIARLLFALKLRFGSRRSFTARFERERAAIQKLLAQCPPERRGEQVLIPRLRGLEDSSRFWSVWMTLEHLRITNTVFANVIQRLSQGEVPERKASTAEVKPGVVLDAGVEAAYERSCDEVLTALAFVADFQNGPRYAHPWFGPLDSFGWHALTAMHMGIHRAQIAKIISFLPVEAPDDA